MKKLAFFLALMAAYNSILAQAPVMVTFAGNGTGGFIGDGGPATAAEFFTPSGVFADTAGNIYITDQNANCVRKVNTAGIVSTIAGTCGTSGYSGDGGAATAAKLYWPEGVAVERNGNVFIADQFNNVIRKVSMATGTISTYAGNNTVGYTGDGGAATNAALWHPADVAVDHVGNVYFVDQDNSCVRKVDLGGTITTVAGNGTAGYTGDGIPGTAAELNFPQGIAADSAGNVYIADFYNNRIRKLSTTGIITTVAGNGTGGYLGDGGPATAAEIYNASAVIVDARGQVFISDYYNSMIRRVDTAGIITTLGGNDTAGYKGDCGPATAAEIYYPEGVGIDKRGNIYIADFGNHRVRMITTTPTCGTTTVEEIQANKVILSPNPSTGKFVLRSHDAASVFEVSVCDNVGKCVYQDSIRAGMEVDLSKYADGVYFARIVHDTNYSYEKLCIIH